MGGQDGYSRNLLSYNEESNSLLAGLNIHPSDRWALGFNVGYTTAEGGLDPFELPADDYVAITPTMSFDFSDTHSYSNIDVSRLNADAMFKLKLTEHFWARLWYKIVDYTDDDPILYDTTGTVQWTTITAGWSF
ncbi:MAG: hypothetical protein MUC56_17625 [Thermoanaerobaculales bacterium]|jgi:hypothetical protein|nr:hypothetical protein [Thermoanaerobaculales bacterium]